MKAMKARTVTLMLSTVAGFGLAFVAIPAWSARPAGVVVFGDSLSDSGNHFIAYGESARQPFEPVPSAPYDIGGHHFSNGQTWIEQLARGTAFAADAGPSLRRSVPGLDYAVGRARARANAPDFPAHDLSSQVSEYLAQHEGLALADHAHALWIGGNDVRDAIVTVLVGGGSLQSQLAAQQILVDALNSIAANIVSLYGSGARKFVVMNVPNPAYTPAVAGLPPVAGVVATQLDTAFNGGLAQLVFSLSNLPGATFVLVDVDAAFAAVRANPGAAGIDDATHPCLKFGTVGDAICASPDRYLFWDATHPTRRGHAVVAQAAEEAVEALLP